MAFNEGDRLLYNLEFTNSSLSWNPGMLSGYVSDETAACRHYINKGDVQLDKQNINNSTIVNVIYLKPERTFYY